VSEPDRLRLDAALVARGLARSRSQAQAMIAAGKVRIDGRVAARSAEPVRAEQVLEAAPVHAWVSRGGLKLEHALNVFSVDPLGRACLDLGASTGGFTQVLLARGARRVVAVDVGRDQLDGSLRTDPRVASLEAQDARTLVADQLGEPPTLVTADVSFIGLVKVLPVPLALSRADADLVALFKPQFEVGPAKVGKGGIVTDRTAVMDAREALAAGLAGLGWAICSWTDSPVAGGDGNAEHLFHARRRDG
jgi:23S rRNA (cytidine1920-2'-O)/16S rRNA (cytidine1409-2'-O)-methyltransferase